MLAPIDRFLNRITMYRLMAYYLFGLVLVAFVFGIFGILPYSPLALIWSGALLTLICWSSNELLARAWQTQTNAESSYITAFILTLIITPIAPTNGFGMLFLVLAGVIAMASKYILAINRKHIFNPAALAVAVTAFTIGGYASWWIGGNIPMLAFVVIGGLLIARKIQRFDLIVAFLLAALASVAFTNTLLDPATAIEKGLIHTCILFFAFVMITEPATTPPSRGKRIAYGVFVGLLFSPAIHVSSTYSTPELALLTGNLLSYILGPKKKYMLTLTEKSNAGGGIYDFTFTAGGAMNFKPGQYMEWTLGHKNPDTRGNRRYFTIASSPTEHEVHIGVRLNSGAEDPATLSSFKKELSKMGGNDQILAGQLAGDFTLPNDAKQKLAFIAGGIGITPFRSMIKYLSDKNEARDLILFYSIRTANEAAYKNIFDEAGEKIGLKTIYAVTDSETLPDKNGHHGRIDAALIKKEIPDYQERAFYISGTHEMVESMKKIVRGLGVPATRIKTDFFPGF